MPQWMVKLSGHAFDLRALCKVCTDPGCRVAEDADGAYYLTRTAYSAMQGYEVDKAARAWLDSINGLMKLHTGVVAIDGVYEIKDDGTRTGHHFGSVQFSAPSHLRVDAVVIGPDGHPVPSPEIELIRKRLEFAERAPTKQIRNALRYLNRSVIGDAAFWMNLNKAYDIICADICGDKRKRKQVIPGLGWKVTRAAMDSFEEAANNPAISGDTARHGDEWTTSQGVTAFNESEALAFIHHLLNSWIDWKLAPTP